MPYHRLGENKYQMLDLVYELTGLRPPSAEELQNALEIFRGYDLDVAVQE
jgi:pyruvate formate lyase activating enzyme